MTQTSLHRWRDSLPVVIDAAHAADVDAWRHIARRLLREHARPEALVWRLANEVQADLLCTPAPHGNENFQSANVNDVECEALSVSASARPINRVPKEFLRLSASVACHSDAERWDALYRVLFRLTHGEPQLLDVATDPEIHRLFVMDKSVRRDVHKMHAFVRFRATASVSSDATHYVAWFEPNHHIVQRATAFFTRRFPSMSWSILTPRECAHWNGTDLQFTPGVSRSHAPKDDELEDLWRSYYSHIFNPARVGTATMQAEMPRRYWTNLPEAQLIAGLTRDAPGRVMRMLHQMDAAPAPIPEELRSRVGNVDIPTPTRSKAMPYNSRSSSSDAMSAPLSGLDTPSAVDPVHDPGVSSARERSAAASAIHTEGQNSAIAGGLLETDRATIRIGTASWTDPTLLQRGVFYPVDAATAEDRLRFYASKFPLVEVDSTYYVPPTRAMAAAWAERSPDGFVFDIKAFALMTGHAAEVKRMPDWLRRQLPRSLASNSRVYPHELPIDVVDDVWQRFQHALTPLRDSGKLGPILLQFPRWFTPTRENADVLRTARERLGAASAAVEFRNPDWVTGRMTARTIALLESLQLTYVVLDAPPGTRSSMPPIAPITTPDLSVVRLHGRRVETWEARNAVVSERYRYLYDSDQLTEWTNRITDLAERIEPLRTNFPDMAKAKQGVHVVFNNCHANYGTTNAIEITKTLIEFDKFRRRAPRV